MARLIEVSQGNYSEIESGKRGINTEQLSKIATSYNVNLNWLLTGEREMFLAPKLEEGEFEELKNLVRKVPKILEIAKLVKEHPEEASTQRAYTNLALKHSALLAKVSRLPEKQIEALETIIHGMG